MDRQIYACYVSILSEELFPALGCTEPIAVAYAAAKARDVLGKEPDHLDLICSGNIIKNVKGVTVPASGGLKGLEVAAVLGAVGGDAEKKLEVLDRITDAHREKTVALVRAGFCSVDLAVGEENLYIRCCASAGEETASVEIRAFHTNITRIEKNGAALFVKDGACGPDGGADKTMLNLRDIYAFANTFELPDVQDIIERQIEMNSTIAAEGIENRWGAAVGAELLKNYGSDIKFRAAALAAAGSDARMSGCALPVVINSGSGNQGITVSVPVIEYARHLGAPREKLIRALVLANLISLDQKRHIGSLSAYCGATSAGAAAAAGVAYLYDEPFNVICDTVTNAITTIGGMVCDGAKPSCAAKIRSAVDTGLLSFFLARDGHVFSDGEGLVAENAEKTIENIGYVGRVGMQETDREILKIMIGKQPGE